MAGYRRQNVCVDFGNENNARHVMGKLHAAGKIGAWNTRNVFGKVYVRYQDVATKAWRDMKAVDVAFLGIA